MKFLPSSSVLPSNRSLDDPTMRLIASLITVATLSTSLLVAQPLSNKHADQRITGSTKPERTPVRTTDASEVPRRLWYDSPAANNDDGWVSQSLPLGNGYMGVNVFGGVEHERLQITENSLVDSPGGQRRPVPCAEIRERPRRSC